eukprot:TRINITY_DN13967_c0_g5_i1.p1 TRINITY_DN13967_c0_g5~~TRINITY_DN13967_c0_g5_i1.p1  ORF type:complete len:222 (+),score=56.08 TRINITY_DN13967_c0_g5_i1:116-781(+)
MADPGSLKRREWDVADFQKRAEERSKQEQEQEQALTLAHTSGKKKVDKRVYPALKPKTADGAPQREYLQARDFDLGIQETVGRVAFVNAGGKAVSDEPGWYCKVCDCVLKDSISYTNHVNGKKHQKMLGVSMRVQTAELDKVQEKLATLKEKRDIDDETKAITAEAAVQRRLLSWEEGEEQRREKDRARKRRRKEVQRAEGTSEVDEDEAMRRVMGFGSFS